MSSRNSFISGFSIGILMSLLGVAVAFGMSFRNRSETPMEVQEIEEIVPKGEPQVVPDMLAAASDGPIDAPVVIVEYADFVCPYCRKAYPTMEKVMQNYEGRVRRVFHHYPLTESPGKGSFVLHEAAACAQEQNRFWDYYRELMQGQGYRSEEQLFQTADKIGLDVGEFESCFRSGRQRDFILEEKERGIAKGIRGTPHFIVNGRAIGGAYPYSYFQKLIDALLDPSKAKNFKIPDLQAAPKEVNFDDLEGRPSVGPESAAITLVEFGDFHCPFCKRVSPTLDQLMENFSGKIRRVWRHFPLPIHQGADLTHEASECAAEQGKFWEYKKRVFERQSELRSEGIHTKLAKEAGLKMKNFKKCFSSRKYKDVVLQDLEKGQASGVSGTPAVFVNGQLVSGAQPYDRFEKIVQRKLKQDE